MMVVFAGVVAFHERVVQCGTRPLGGFASRAAEIRLPGDENTLLIYVIKPRSLPPEVLSELHVEPLLVEVTRCPSAYGLLLGELQLQTYALDPAEGSDVARMITAYLVPAVRIAGVAKLAEK